jgi:Tfp pilus assembly protein PilV
MISLVRYGFLGIADIEVWISMLVLAVITFSLFLLNLRLFQRGYKLRS